tara:strand:- start:1087 stop:2970 length:1884 start_codon:yes stop_codon:yes gene_type:complete
MNNSGHFRAGKGGAEGISFDGTNLTMSSSRFYLGGGAQFISGSNGILEISSDNFSLGATGNVTMSGDLQAHTGNFRDVNIIGTLVKNSSGNPGLQLVETWAPTGSVVGGGGVNHLDGKLHQLSSSTWGWTVESSGDADRDVVWSDTTDPDVLLTPAQYTNTTYQKMDPPKSLFKATWEMEGQSLGTGRDARGYYDANIYKTNYGSPLGTQGGVPKIGIEENIFKIRTTTMALPFTQSDIFECNLEFASKDSGNWGGFYNTLTVSILKASDDSVLYSESKDHSGNLGLWTTWSIPMVIKAGLITKNPSTGATEAAFILIDEVKIQLETSAGNHSSGGGTMDGVVFTEMRIRKSPYHAFVSTNTVNTDFITPGVGSTATVFTDGNFIASEKVGIGNTAPPQELTVQGQISASHSGDDNPTLYVKNSNGQGNGSWNNGALIQSWVGDTDGIDLRNINTGDYFLGNNQQGNGIAMYDGTGGVVIFYNGSAVVRVDSSGGLEVDTGALGVGVTPSGTAGRIDASNDVVAFSSSDIRFKKNTRPISDALFKVQQIRGIEFDWIPSEEHHGYEGHDVGVVAQEIIKVLPEVVQTRESGHMAVKYEKIVPLLVEAIKEQQEQINELKEKLDGITR